LRSEAWNFKNALQLSNNGSAQVDRLFAVLVPANPSQHRREALFMVFENGSFTSAIVMAN
jgi:hypothetical protein